MPKFHWLLVHMCDRLYASAIDPIIMLDTLPMMETFFLGAPFKMPIFMSMSL